MGNEAQFVPGVMRCAKCSFVLHRVTLHAYSGGVSAGDNKTEPCPNGCGPLWPMTWKQQAEELQERGEEQVLRAVAAEKVAAELYAALKAFEREFDERLARIEYSNTGFSENLAVRSRLMAAEAALRRAEAAGLTVSAQEEGS